MKWLENRKLRLSEMVKKEREAELQKKVHQANLKRIQRENALVGVSFRFHSQLTLHASESIITSR
jgi:hypothetical protein